MIIMTYNVQSGWNNETKRERNYDCACSVIREAAADIVGLNEVGNKPIDGIPSHSGYMGEKLGMEDFFAPAFVNRGYPYGNALLSKYPIKAKKRISIPDPPRVKRGYYETRCMYECTVDTELGEISVLGSHFGLVGEERANAVKTVADTIDRIKLEAPDRHIIFMGDLNMEPDDPLLAPIFSRMTEVTFSLGTEEYTSPSDSPRHKIDYIFISDGVKAESAGIINTRASDHFPIVARISLK